MKVFLCKFVQLELDFQWHAGEVLVNVCNFSSPVQDTRSGNGRTLLDYIARSVAAAQPPHGLLADELPSVISNALKISLMVPPMSTCCKPCRCLPAKDNYSEQWHAYATRMAAGVHTHTDVPGLFTQNIL